MFQLIVAVISIALIAALAIASIFYGGDAFTKSSEKAHVTTLMNQAQQISGAASLYKTDYGRLPSTVALLVTNPEGNKYLTIEPTPPKIATGSWEIVGGKAVIGFAGTAAEITDLATILCAGPVSGNAGGEIIRQNGQCVTIATGAVAVGAAADGFGFPL